MVLYFTGTGNSRYLARRIAEGLEMPLYDLNACIKAGNAAPVQTGRDVVLVTPTYAWRIPRVVSQWLGNTELTGAERIWFVMDCGNEIGNAAGYNRQLAVQKQLQYMGTAQIIMPENYIAMFNAPQKEQARSIVEQAEPALQKVLAQLKAGQEFPPPREKLYDRLMSGPVNPVFYRFFVKADAFRATDACIGCGKCVELCPLNNIHLENGKPVWGKNCTHCMACICYCPKEAIEYGKRAGESHGIILKRWKGSGTCEGERKLDEVFILAWVGTKTRQLGQSNKRNEGLGQQRLLEFGRDAGGQSGHLWGTVCCIFRRV